LTAVENRMRAISLVAIRYARKMWLSTRVALAGVLGFVLEAL
jgi:hypothetical protein